MATSVILLLSINRLKQRLKKVKKQTTGDRQLPKLQSSCLQIDDLYEDMKANGYRSHVEQEWTRIVRGVAVPDEMCVAIDRHGNPIYCVSGRCRMATAELPGIDIILAAIQIEHADCDSECSDRQRVTIQP